MVGSGRIATLPDPALGNALSGRVTGFAPGVGILGRQQRKEPRRRRTGADEEEEEEEGASAAATDVSEMHVVDMCAAPRGETCHLLPCSATGTGACNPNVLTRSSDLGDLLSVQSSLARHVIDNVLDVGGLLVYATCSLLRSEGGGIR